jgi:hypothetical protein
VFAEYVLILEGGGEIGDGGFIDELLFGEGLVGEF